MKSIKILIKIFIFIGIYIGAQFILKFAIMDDSSVISRVMMHDMYAEKNIDILFCGASHCQLGVDPKIISEATGMNCFNCASSAQGLETSYALIKEVAKKNPLKKVFVNVDYSVVTRTKPNIESMYIVSDYMKPSLNKYSYLLNATDFDYYVNSFAPIHKGRGYTKNITSIIDNIKYKLTPAYYNYEYADPSYAGKGHISSDTVIEEGSLYHTGDLTFDSYEIPDRQKKFLNQIISFCKKNGIELTFIGIPVTNFYLERLPNYDSYVDMMSDYFTSQDVNYCDFNRVKSDILDLRDDTNFNDDEHLNCYGSEKFSSFLAQCISNGIAKEAFFNSYKDKLESEEFAVSGVMLLNKDEYGDSIFKKTVDEDKLTGVQISADEFDDMMIIPIANKCSDGRDIRMDISNVDDGKSVKVIVDGEVTNEFVFN